MPSMRFLRLCLLSTKEGRAFEIKFRKNVTVLKGKNGTGKSAVLKSLYQTLGAKPHKVDQSWKSAAVSALLDFSIDETKFTALRARDRYAIFHSDSGELVIDTSSVTRELGPVLANLLEFGLLMTDRDEKLVIPPPAYAFSPFYVDQDGGWAKPWSSFDAMYLPRGKKTLSSYHTGLRTNAYYSALAMREKQKRRIKELETERTPLSVAIEEIGKLTTGLAIDLDMNSFESEAEELAKRSSGLNVRQAEFRDALTKKSSEKAIWTEQRDMLRSALKEMEQTVVLAAQQPDEVDCPTCGHSYTNDITTRFGLIAEYDDLFDALQTGETKIRELDSEIESLNSLLASIEAQISQIDEILSVEAHDVSLGDIISAQGRNETTGILRERIAEIDEMIGGALALLKEAETATRKESNPDRAKAIRAQFDRYRRRFSELLDAPMQTSNDPIASPKLARGSAGTRELLAYYFAVLFCAKEHASSAFCPVVIDAPNQQGQDSEHLDLIYNFLVSNRPKGSQLIFSAEEPDLNENTDVEIIELGNEKNHLLRSEDYERVFDEMRPYLNTFL